VRSRDSSLQLCNLPVALFSCRLPFPEFVGELCIGALRAWPFLPAIPSAIRPAKSPAAVSKDGPARSSGLLAILAGDFLTGPLRVIVGAHDSRLAQVPWRMDVVCAIRGFSPYAQYETKDRQQEAADEAPEPELSAGIDE